MLKKNLFPFKEVAHISSVDLGKVNVCIVHFLNEYFPLFQGFPFKKGDVISVIQG